jgi:hypothetical protein
MVATIIAIIIFIVFAILGIAFIISWKSALKDKDILHGVLFMWAMIAILIATIFFTARHH